MEYKLKYVIKKYDHGWSVWLQREDRKFLIGSALESEEAVSRLIKEIRLQEPSESKDNVEARSPNCIGNGEYLVYYKEPIKGKINKFTGICENFNGCGLNVFWNEEKEQMLIVKFLDIVGLYPIQ
ncbi:hypothetical protein PQ478_08895 [Alkalihalophilus pseudofirmus]|uniref:hypothetical protein n=1 Tax=Alkalihalophilus pseudofirmus TaxID=79885 RepID=UPI00259BF0C6|nr:hypothetical protein [Alkalihalophilus pseudofirmus]WEG18587.1 hypothetical protein PQ478_08895 [Alkalihalophilus pseudofirmus]